MELKDLIASLPTSGEDLEGSDLAGLQNAVGGLKGPVKQTLGRLGLNPADLEDLEQRAQAELQTTQASTIDELLLEMALVGVRLALKALL